MKIALYYIIGISIVLAGCDDSFDALNAVNSPPEISFSPDGALVELYDSVKLSPKVGTLEYSGQLYLKDPEDGINAIAYSFIKKEGVFYIDGVELNENEPYVIGNINNPEYVIELGSGLGDYEIKIKVIDNLGSEKEAILTLVAYDNLSPVARLSVSKVGVLSELQYSFDASESYDKDLSRGGGVVRYQFTVNGIDAPIVENSTINYIFPRTGGYEVQLKVQDNDGTWSEQVLEIVSVL